MSGHSKWNSIKHQKAASDAKKGAAFTRAAKLITLAAREGGDPEMNFKLRMAIAQAKNVNMPKDNIERAIKRGTGEDAGVELTEAVYEGFGPGGVAIVVTAVTDNSNRTFSDVRTTLTKNGGTLGAANSVSWNFDIKGVVRFELKNLNKEAIELAAIDAGADDIAEEDGTITITTPVKNLQMLKEALDTAGADIAYADLEYIPKTSLSISDEDKTKLERLLAILDELDDVTNYFTNAE